MTDGSEKSVPENSQMCSHNFMLCFWSVECLNYCAAEIIIVATITQFYSLFLLVSQPWYRHTSTLLSWSGKKSGGVTAVVPPASYQE